jgi:hypothetical protein
MRFDEPHQRGLTEEESLSLGVFSERAREIPLVNFVVATALDGLRIYTGLQRRTLRSCRLLYELEDFVRQEFPRLSVDFHIVYTDGRPWTEFLSEDDAIVSYREIKKSDPSKGIRGFPEEPSIGPFVRTVFVSPPESLHKSIIPPEWPVRSE